MAIVGLREFAEVAQRAGDEAARTQALDYVRRLLQKGFDAAFIRGGKLHGTLEEGVKNDIDGALLPIINFGIVRDPKVIRDTVERMELLKVASGGYRRVRGTYTDPKIFEYWYEQEEFLFVDFTLPSLTGGSAETREADAMLQRIVDKSAADHDIIPEMYVAVPASFSRADRRSRRALYRWSDMAPALMSCTCWSAREGQVTFVQTRLAISFLLIAGGPASAQTGDWANLARYRASQPIPEAYRLAPGHLHWRFITEGWEGQPFIHSNSHFVDRGISGQTAPQMLVRFRSDAIALKPAIVHIMAGTNDIAGNTGPETEDEIFGYIVSMVQLAQANHIKVILASIPPAADFPWQARSRPGTEDQELERSSQGLRNRA